MVNSLFGGQQPPPQITMSFGTLNNPMNLLNGLGVRIPQPQPQPPQPAQNSPQTSSQVPTAVSSTSSSAPRRISY